MTRMITLKFEDKFVKDIDAVVKKSHYASRAEYIRSVVREDLLEKRRKEALKRLDETYGMGKRLGMKEPTNEDLRVAGERAFWDLVKKKGYKIPKD